MRPNKYFPIKHSCVVLFVCYFVNACNKERKIPVVYIEMEDGRIIKHLIISVIAPNTVANFVLLVEQ